jgi:hypothetical protein
MATNRNAGAMFDTFHEVGTAGNESVHIWIVFNDNYASSLLASRQLFDTCVTLGLSSAGRT